MLALTRLDGAAPALADVDPAALVRSAVVLVEARAEREATTIVCDTAAAPLRACWDAEAVRGALLNLLDNALRHGGRGGLVEVRAEGDSERVRLSVSDQGPGITRSDRARLFGRFARGRHASAGTGLGLHLVDAVARSHGGHVDVMTEEARGSTFTLVLPLVPPRSPKA